MDDKCKVRSGAARRDRVGLGEVLSEESGMDDRCKRCRAPALSVYLCARCAAVLLTKKAKVYPPARDCRRVTEVPDDPEKERRIEALAARAAAGLPLFQEVA